MSLSLIFAHDESGGIGLANALPWKHSDDLQWFKAKTQGHALLMGRHTADGFKKPLPGREHYVLSRTPYQREGFQWISTSDVPDLQRHQTVFVIGGAQIFDYYWPYVSQVHRTLIHQTHECDTFFKPSFSHLMLHQRTCMDAKPYQAAATFETWINPRPQPLPPNG